MPQARSKKRKLQGEIVNTRMNKTVVVRIDRTRIHPLYHKRYIVSKKFHVHDPGGEYKKGDFVEIEETRPLSKTKRWRVFKKLTKLE